MIVVTGATGTVGSRVVRELSERGAKVRAFVRDRHEAEAMLGSQIDLAAGDFLDADSLRRALDGADALFLASPNDPRQVEWETTVLDVAVERRVPKVVKLSAFGAAPGADLDFWDAQGRIEDHLRRSQLPFVLLHPTYYMTNLGAFAEPVRHMGRIFAPMGGAKISMIDPSDVAAVGAAALTDDRHLGATYLLTGPELVAFDQVGQELGALLDRDIEFVPVPDDAARGAMAEAGVPPWLADNLIVLARHLRDGVAEQVTDAVRDVTGRNPRSLGEFLRANKELFAG